MVWNRTEINFSKYGVIFIINPDTEYYIEFVNSLTNILRVNGYKVIKQVGDYNLNHLDIKSTDLVLLVNSSLMYFMSGNSKNIDLVDKIRLIRCDYVLYQSEPKDIQDDYINDKKNVYNNLDPIEVWTHTCDNLTNYYRKIRLIPPLYSIYYEKGPITIRTIASKNRDTLIFMGNITEYRKTILDKLKKYRYFSIKSTIFTDERYRELYRRNLFFINLHRRDHKSTEFFRITSLLSNGLVIISERCNSTDENLLSDTNIYFVDRDKILDKFYELRGTLRTEEIYRRYNIFKNKCKQEDYLLNKN